MGIRILASALATFAAFSIQASTFPQTPPLKLADLTVTVTSTATHSFIPAERKRSNGDRQATGSDHWPDARQPLAQVQRWVF